VRSRPWRSSTELRRRPLSPFPFSDSNTPTGCANWVTDSGDTLTSAAKRFAYGIYRCEGADLHSRPVPAFSESPISTTKQLEIVRKARPQRETL
jgi:hypothetical protein